MIRETTTDDHPDAQLLERFMRDEVDEEERRRVVRHLLSGCAPCVGVTRRLWGLGEPRRDGSPGLAGADLHPASYGGVFKRLAGLGPRSERKALADRREAPERLAELLALSRSARLARIEREERFRTPALCELLIEESRRAVEPRLAAERAEEALAVAERLDSRRCGVTFIRSLLGRAWVCLGNARRRGGDLQGAEATVSCSEPALREGMEAPEQAEFLELKSRLLAERGRLDEAECLLDRALVLVRGLGERHLQGRLLVQKGTIRGWRESWDAKRQGIRLLRQALVLLDSQREPPLAAFALHQLALLLADAGSGGAALGALRQARPLYERHGDGPNLVRLRHLEGRIAEASGSGQAAEAAFLEAGEGFLAEGLGAEAAAVLLDRAILYWREGRAVEMRRLAEDLLPILRTRDVRQGVVAALLFFRDLVETGRITPEGLLAVSHYLNGPPRARRPALR
ncbi:MAG TPA: hypothetical protein VGX68_24315 [Thermoanaerobaculia bacterium]|jgi:tetratricopeptide (TPR) repeat protein|nr:hypothetical protein [Thermoanaerobaculia bacterium]